MNFPPEIHFAQHPDSFGSEVDDGGVLLALETARYVHANRSAMAIWQLLRNNHSLDTLCAAIKERFDVDDERCCFEVSALLERLIEARLVIASNALSSI